MLEPSSYVPIRCWFEVERADPIIIDGASCPDGDDTEGVGWKAPSPESRNELLLRINDEPSAASRTEDDEAGMTLPACIWTELMLRWL
jgi:hypothetical protein